MMCFPCFDVSLIFFWGLSWWVVSYFWLSSLLSLAMNSQPFQPLWNLSGTLEPRLAGFNVETVEYRNLRLTVWDIGGSWDASTEKPLWMGIQMGIQICNWRDIMDRRGTNSENTCRNGWDITSNRNRMTWCLWAIFQLYIGWFIIDEPKL